METFKSWTTTERLIRISSLAFTVSGIIIFITGYHTDGLLMMILGELIDMPKRR